jgi:DNA-binding XRE family transcriptional regulator
MNKPLANRLRDHRRISRLTQDDLATILGYDNSGVVSRHERRAALPSLLVALSYEVLYQAPVSELFTGLMEIVELKVETQLGEFETNLGEQSARSPRAAVIAQKLEWLSQRRNSGYK